MTDHAILESLRNTTAGKVKEFVGCGPKHVCSRLGLLAITALGIVAATGSGAFAAVIGGVGLNIGASVLYTHLEKLKLQSNGRPTLDDALETISKMEARGLEDLQKVADALEVLPVFLKEALTQQKQELLAGVGDLLVAWGATLPFDRLEAGLNRIGAEQQTDHAAQQAQLAALTEHLVALYRLLYRLLDATAADRLAQQQQTREREGRELRERARADREQRLRAHEAAKKELTDAALRI